MKTRPVAPDEKWCLLVIDVMRLSVCLPEQTRKLTLQPESMSQHGFLAQIEVPRFLLVFSAGRPESAKPLGYLEELHQTSLSRAYVQGLMGAYLHAGRREPSAAQSVLIAMAAACFALGRIVSPSPACSDALAQSVPTRHRAIAFSILAQFFASSLADIAALSYCLSMGGEAFWPLIGPGARGPFVSVLDMLLDRGPIELLRPHLGRLTSPLDFAVLLSMRMHPRVQQDPDLFAAVERQMASIGGSASGASLDAA